MKTKRLREYIQILKSIAGKRHKGRNGAICKILAAMEREAQLPWWKFPGPIEIPELPEKKPVRSDIIGYGPSWEEPHERI